MNAQNLLSTVRARMLIGSVHARDALLDPNPASADTHRTQLQATDAAVDAALTQYVPAVDAAGELVIAQLRGTLRVERGVHAGRAHG